MSKSKKKDETPARLSVPEFYRAFSEAGRKDRAREYERIKRELFFKKPNSK